MLEPVCDGERQEKEYGIQKDEGILGAQRTLQKKKQKEYKYQRMERSAMNYT